MYGRARSLDQLAEIEKSNSKLEQAILTYRSVVDLADEEPNQVPQSLLRAAAERCIDRMKFRGVSIHQVDSSRRMYHFYYSLPSCIFVTYLNLKDLLVICRNMRNPLSMLRNVKFKDTLSEYS